MISSKAIAFDLLERLIAGEASGVQQHLMWLLKRKTSADENDEVYSQELPNSLRDVRLANETKDEIVAALETEISKDPKEALITTMCASETGEALRAAARLLVKPVRPLSIEESISAVAPLATFLPFYLSDTPPLLSPSEQKELARAVRNLLNVRGGNSGSERVAIIRIAEFAPRLIKLLERSTTLR